ncbi:HK97 gp10 family phage protein [Sinirhodobacter populi]|uniref:HK97 gp10 family phage protein n=1 Tax=Paenirhodobacter populi TaxID=2306993 RepID=A0A443K9I8_9RHOB|nr:HK97-gp10 family putative phage morphogenesis protein [Sinirhodobacter populi]RWR29461.1 HK97 gp10 family phage protein [Sinirhodobacter populi]
MADDGGLSSFQRRMRAIPDRVRDAVRPAMEKSAEEICALARSLCPVDEGDLKASIGWTWGAPPEGSLALGAVSDGAALSITVYAGNDKAFYARWVEFGTQGGIKGQRVANPGAGKKQAKTKGRFSYRTHSGTSAQPFFYPAFRFGKKRAVNRIKRAIGKAVKDNR